MVLNLPNLNLVAYGPQLPCRPNWYLTFMAGRVPASTQQCGIPAVIVDFLPCYKSGALREESKRRRRKYGFFFFFLWLLTWVLILFGFLGINNSQHLFRLIWRVVLKGKKVRRGLNLTTTLFTVKQIAILRYWEKLILDLNLIYNMQI